jgi:hypothetical protein
MESPIELLLMIRRGAMRDATCLKKAVAGVSTALVAVIGAHSNRTENSGLTREYISALQVDNWNM